MTRFIKKYLNKAFLAITFALPIYVYAAAFTDYMENKLIDQIFRGAAAPTTSTLYVGLLTVTCTDSAAGTEVSGGSYARSAVVSGTGTWSNTVAAGNTGSTSSGTGGTTSNVASIPFPAPSANWGTIVAFGIYDASTSGNLLICGTVTPNKTVSNGDAAPAFAAGALTFTIDNN